MNSVVKIVDRDPILELLAAAEKMGRLARLNAARTEADRRFPQDLIE